MVQIENLEFSYGKNKELFSDLNLNLTAGHVYGLLGKNGEGKTSLLNLLSGLLFPQKGGIEVMGCLPRQRKPSFLSKIFLVEDEVSFPKLNSLTMKTYARSTKPFYPCFDEKLLEEAMAGFGVSMDDKLNALSYGQVKKAWLSFGIACNTPLLLMDEPTNGLDIPSKSYFRRLISSVASDERCIIISTHQVRDVENLIDSFVILHENKILLNVNSEEITDRLVFRQVKDGEDALFAEESLKGTFGVLPNLNKENSRLDVELFFNGVLSNPERTREIFNSPL